MEYLGRLFHLYPDGNSEWALSAKTKWALSAKTKTTVYCSYKVADTQCDQNWKKVSPRKG